MANLWRLICTSWIRSHLELLQETFWTTALWDQVVVHDDRLRDEGVRQELRAWKTLGEHVLHLRGESVERNAVAQGMVVLAMLERSWFYWSLADGPFPFDDLVDTAAATVGAVIGLAASSASRSSVDTGILPPVPARGAGSRS